MSGINPPVQLTEEQRSLASDPKHLNLARHIASKKSRRVPRMAEELESAALCGLVDAARKYTPSGSSFVTYAYHVIRYAVIECCCQSHQKGYRKKSERDRYGVCRPVVAIQSVVHNSNGDDRFPHPAGDDRKLPGWELDDADAVYGLTSSLPDGERHAVRRYYSLPSPTMRQIAVEMGLTQSRVSQLIKSGLAMLKEVHRVGERVTCPS